jgi:Condensation domain
VPFFARSEGLPSPPTPPPELSFAQETMLFWDKLVPHSAVYNVPIALELQGQLDRQALARSLNLIITRHQVLHSRFLFSRGEPAAILGPHLGATTPLIDLSGLPANEKTAAAQDAANAEARRPFQLANDLMLRAALLRLSETHHILVLTMHHIAADGWSVGVLLQELSQAYLSFVAGTAPLLPRLSVQYSDFARWQRHLLQGPATDRCLSFWKHQFQNFSGDTELLPLDHARPANQTFVGATLRTTLPASTLSDLAEVGQLRRGTAFMVMLAALQALLHHHSQAPEAVIGVPVANRARPEFEPLIGCFINMVAVRGDLSGNPSFLELLSRVREAALAAFLHPELPFSEVVRHLRPKRSVNRTPWFQTQLVFQSYPMPAIHWPGLTVRRFEVDTATSKFDLSVLVEMKEELEVGFEYNIDLFDSSTMQRLLDEYANILRGLASRPDTRLRDLSVSASELVETIS